MSSNLRPQSFRRHPDGTIIVDHWELRTSFTRALITDADGIGRFDGDRLHLKVANGDATYRITRDVPKEDLVEVELVSATRVNPGPPKHIAVAVQA